MTSLFDSEIIQILPDVLAKKPETKALSYAISQMVKRILGYCEKTPLYAAIDKQTDDVLDLLAIELDAQYYDTNLDIESKRSIIKGTLAWYLTLGTPSAVENMVKAIFGEGQVSEWFEYGDLAYHFKITTNAQMTPELFDKLKTMTKKVKNVRSELRSVEIIRKIDHPEYFRSGINAVHHITVLNDSIT